MRLLSKLFTIVIWIIISTVLLTYVTIKEYIDGNIVDVLDIKNNAIDLYDSYSMPLMVWLVITLILMIRILSSFIK